MQTCNHQLVARLAMTHNPAGHRLHRVESAIGVRYHASETQSSQQSEKVRSPDTEISTQGDVALA